MTAKQLNVILPHINEYSATKPYLKILALWTDKEGIKLEKKLLPSSLMRGWSVRQKMGTVLGQEKTNRDLWNNWTIGFVLATEDILLRSNAILGAVESYPDSRVLDLHASMAGKLMAYYLQPGPKPPEAQLIWINRSQLFAIEDPVAGFASTLEKGMNNFYANCESDFARIIAKIRGYELETLLRDAKESVARLVSRKDSIMSVEVPGEPVLLAGKGNASSFYREVMLRSEEEKPIENYHCSEFEIQYSSHLLLPSQMQQNDWVSLLLYVKNKMQ
ncbi:MAG: hypothetical protein NT051_04445 [Candidatus Micrarchaeota archaeon]|nr:hypothetical protein [Candidatus Micrarchaeota archaeon]